MNDKYEVSKDSKLKWLRNQIVPDYEGLTNAPDEE
jgi:hypothetical protein